MPTPDLSQSPDPASLARQATPSGDPLTDCLLLLGKLYDLPLSRTSLRAGLPLVRDRLTSSLFPRAADRAGLHARLVHYPLARFHSGVLPAVLLLDDGEACLLTAVDRLAGQATVLLPETGLGANQVSLNEIEARYTGYTFFVRPRFRKDRTIDQQLRRPRGRHWFWSTLFSSWRIYRDVLLASFLINLFALAGPFFTMNVYDRVIPNLAFETLWVLGIGIGVVYVFNLLLQGLRGYFIDEAGKNANLRLSAALLEKVLGLRLEVRPQSVGAFAKKVQQFDEVRNFITSFSITALIDLPFMVLALGAVWYLGGSIVLVQLAAILLMALLALGVQMPLRNAVQQSFDASAQKNAILVEGIAGLETVKMLNAESQVQRGWEDAVSFIATWSGRSRMYAAAVNHGCEFLMNLSVVATVIAGVYRIAAGELSQGGIIALLILSRQAIAPMSRVAGLATRFHRARTALKELNAIMALPGERSEDRHFLLRGSCEGRVAFEQVDFAYPGQSGQALRNISLTIQPGEKVAIIGPIGSGKTTLGKLLLGLYQPTAGMVTLDGTDIRQIDPAELRRFIGAVPQDVTLFRGTVRENITLGSPEADDAMILRAAELSGVSAFVARHPLGYDMQVGEQGRGLSGGQRQSVVLARALLLNPPVLLFDEPTSSMDNRTESLIKEHLEQLLPGKTLILITHRGSLLSLVDRIVLLDNGVIVADGPRNQVMTAMKSGQIHIDR